MKGYVARKGDRWYAVIYEGLDPITGRERRSWHPAGTDRADAERLAARLAREHNGRNDPGRSLSFGVYLTARWLPGKRLVLRDSTYDGYRRNVERHILPDPRRHRRCVDSAPTTSKPSTNGCSTRPTARRSGPQDRVRGPPRHPRRPCDAVRNGLVSRNVALVAHAPRLRSIPKVEQQAWTADELRRFCGPPLDIGCSPPCGWPRSPECAATNSSASAGTTSTRPPRPCPSTVDWSRSATSSTRPAARPATPAAASTSTPPPSTSSSLAAVAARRATRSSGSTPTGVDVHRRRRRADPPACHLASVRAHRPPRRRAGHPTARPAPHPRHPAHRSRRPGQGRQRTPRARHARPSRSTPTSTCCPACKPTPPASSSTLARDALLPADRSGRTPGRSTR